MGTQCSKFTSNIPMSDGLINKVGEKLWYWKFYASKRLFILKKYAHLKEELLHCALPLTEYQVLTKKCETLQSSTECKMMQAMDGNVGHFKYYNVSKGDALSTDHVMALLVYCNFDVLCNAFIATFDCKLPSAEAMTVSELNAFKQKHREYANWARLMREICECFGKQMDAQSNNLSLYHGVTSQRLLFAENVRFCQPTSCTSKLSVSLQYGSAKDDGLILEIEPNENVNDGMFYFAKEQVQIFSDFPDEMESILIGGHQSVKIKSILNMDACQNYKIYWTAIHILEKVVIGHYDFDKNKLTKSVRLALKHLIDNGMRSGKEDVVVPDYISKLFHWIAHKMEYKIKVNMPRLANILVIQ